MAIVYCDPSATGTGSGLNWTDAETDLQTAITNATNGGRVYFKDDGVTLETTAASVTYTFPTGTGITEVIGCLSGTTANPPGSSDLATKGHANAPTIITTTALDDINFLNNCYVSGVKVSSASNMSMQTSAEELQIWEDCVFSIATISGSKVMRINIADGNGALWKNCDLTFDATNGGYFRFENGNRLIWDGGATINSPTSSQDLFDITGESTRAELHGVDLSSMTSARSLADFDSAAHRVELNRCKIPSGITRVNSFGGTKGAALFLYSCDSADTSYQFEHHTDLGNLTTTISKHRTSGASDPEATSYSFIVTGTNNSELYVPYKVKIADLWVDASTAKTFTVHIAQDHATVTPTALQNDEIWIEWHYKKSSSPLSIIDDDRMADILATPADQATSTEAWTGLLTETTKQELSGTTSGGDEGQVEVFLCANLTSSQSCYVCPEVEVEVA